MSRARIGPTRITCCFWLRIRWVREPDGLVSEGYLLANGTDPAVAFTPCQAAPKG